MAEIFTLFPQVIYKSKLQNHENLKERLADDLIKKYKQKYPKGDPIIVAIQTGRLEDVKLVIKEIKNIFML